MEFTLGEIFGYAQPLQRLTAQRLPVAAAYKMAQLKRKIMAEVKVVDEQRQALVKEHGVEDEKGNFSCTPDCEGWPALVTDLNTLFEQTTKVDDIEKVMLPQIVNGQQLIIEPDDLISLERLIGITGLDEPATKPKAKKKDKKVKAKT